MSRLTIFLLLLSIFLLLMAGFLVAYSFTASDQQAAQAMTATYQFAETGVQEIFEEIMQTQQAAQS